MALGDVFKVTLLMSLDNVQCRPGFYVVEGDGAPGVTTQALADFCVANLAPASMVSPFSEHLSFNGVQVDDVQPAVAAYTKVFFGPYSGSVADDNPPSPQDSMVITWHTALKGVKGAYAADGRSYIPGLYSTGQISGFLTAPMQLALQAMAEQIAVPFINDGTSYQMHVVSFNPGTKPRTVRAIQPVTGFTLNNIVRAQRRRQPDRGI